MILKYVAMIIPFLLFSLTAQEKGRPNFIFLMADDLGWADTGFNGNKHVLTPNLDKMANEGMVFENFYSLGPICSPTRASVLTGRHYLRYGLTRVNDATLPKGEINMAMMAQSKGYKTGHFGKWHLGTLDPQSKIGPMPRTSKRRFVPPWHRGYEESFCTETNIATWDPLDEKGLRLPKHRCQFFKNGQKVNQAWKGSSEKIITDEALKFISRAKQEGKPFFTTLWFYGPHTPVRAGEELRKLYPNYNLGQQHYYGCITSIDLEVGRLQKHLKALGMLENTIIFFCSDNGPEGRGEVKQAYTPYHGSHYGSAGTLKGRKRSLYEGGVKVPAFVHWPAVVKAKRSSKVRVSTLDYLPTLMELIDYKLPDQRPIDGESILPLLNGEEWKRKGFIPFGHAHHVSHRASIIQDDFKLYFDFGEKASVELYDLKSDPDEKYDILAKHPERVAKMRGKMKAWLESAKHSFKVGDYPAYKKQGMFIQSKL